MSKPFNKQVVIGVKGAHLPNNELEELQIKANKVTDKSLESTRRILTLCEETKDYGIRTIVALDQQGEQLDRVEEDMDKIHNEMNEAKKNLKAMENCCGISVCTRKDGNIGWKPSEDGKIMSGQPNRVVDQRNGSGLTTTSYIAKY